MGRRKPDKLHDVRALRPLLDHEHHDARARALSCLRELREPAV
jgi:hypothetical protein